MRPRSRRLGQLGRESLGPENGPQRGRGQGQKEQESLGPENGPQRGRGQGQKEREWTPGLGAPEQSGCPVKTEVK